MKTLANIGLRLGALIALLLCWSIIVIVSAIMLPLTLIAIPIACIAYPTSKLSNFINYGITEKEPVV